MKLHPTDSWKLSAMSVPISGSDQVMIVSSAKKGTVTSQHEY